MLQSLPPSATIPCPGCVWLAICKLCLIIFYFAQKLFFLSLLNPFSQHVFPTVFVVDGADCDTNHKTSAHAFTNQWMTVSGNIMCQ